MKRKSHSRVFFLERRVDVNASVANQMGLDGLRGANAVHIRNVINMIAHGDEQVEKQFPSHLHFHLHCTTTLEGFPAADDER